MVINGYKFQNFQVTFKKWLLYNGFLVMSHILNNLKGIYKTSRNLVCPEGKLFISFSRMSFIFCGKCTSEKKLIGKTAIITGCNTGLGKINVQDFFKRGCRVIMACRDVDKAEKTAKGIQEGVSANDHDATGTIIVKRLDLSSLASVRSCAQEILDEEDRIDILVNNAGVMLCPYQLTEDGFELQMGTNHLGHFLFTLLLLPRIIKSAPARIINLSSVAHKHGTNNFDDINWKNTPYSSLKAYGQSKLANIHFTTELSRKLKGTGVTVYAVHPGWVKTELGRHLDEVYFRGVRTLIRLMIGPFMKTPEQGAQTQINCAVEDRLDAESGLYYADCRPTRPYSVAEDQQAAANLWNLSEKLVNYNGNPFFPM